VRVGVARPVRALVVATAAAVFLTGCADKEPEAAAPAPAPPAATPAAAPSSARTSAPDPATPTTTTTVLPGMMPTPVSVSDSPVDASRLRSTDDLAAVFGCPAAVPPIRLTAAPVPSGATTPPAPDAIVCASALADKEALFLWYAPTPEAKLGALTAALDRARYVHAGPNWVAAGMINAQMGTVGGEVYR